MKNKTILIAALACVLCGCSSSLSISKMQGHGTKREFEASYGHVWKASLLACATPVMTIYSQDKKAGEIIAYTRPTMQAWGDNIGIWVTNISETQCRVEVVSRNSGPHVFSLRTWEKPILDSIGVQLDIDKK